MKPESYETIPDDQGAHLRRKSKLRATHNVSGKTLKTFAAVTLLCYHVSLSVFQNGLIHVSSYTTAELNELIGSSAEMLFLTSASSVLQLVGALGIPVAAFLLVEGFLHTSSLKRYFLTLLGFAVVSEVPYDLAMSSTLLDWSNQNLLFTLALCLVMLFGLKVFDREKQPLCRVMQALIVIAGLFWGSLLNGLSGFSSLNGKLSMILVLLTAGYYLLRAHSMGRIFFGMVVSLPFYTAPISGFLLYQYSGERGQYNKYFFYALYPAALLGCALAVLLLG